MNDKFIKCLVKTSLSFVNRMKDIFILNKEHINYEGTIPGKYKLHEDFNLYGICVSFYFNGFYFDPENNQTVIGMYVNAEFEFENEIIIICFNTENSDKDIINNIKQAFNNKILNAKQFIKKTEQIIEIIDNYL